MAISEGVPLVVPQMGVVEDVIVLEWFVEDGAEVSEGQRVVAVETEKADTDLEAPASGRLAILVPAGDDEIPVGTILAKIL